MKGNHTLLIQGARSHPIRRHHTSITWIGGPTREENRLKTHHVSIQGQEGALISHYTKEERLVGLAHGRLTMVVGRWAMGPTAFELRRGISLLAPNIGSREHMLNSLPRRGWLPSIYMWGGAPFWKEQHLKQHQKYSQDVAFTFSCKGLRTSGVQV